MLLESAATGTEMPSHKTDQFLFWTMAELSTAGSETSAVAAQSEWQEHIRAEIVEV